MSMIIIAYTTCHNVELTFYDYQRDKGWRWDNQNDNCHQHARMHNSPPMIAKVRWMGMDDQHNPCHQHPRINSPPMIARGVWRMYLESSEWSPLLPAMMNNSPPMIASMGWRVDIRSLTWSLSPTCHDAELTSFDFKSKLKNEHKSSAWSLSLTCHNT